MKNCGLAWTHCSDKQAAPKRNGPDFSGPIITTFTELELPALATSSFSERPFSWQALSSWLRSTLIDSPLHQNFATS
jgi:hypothetical protein